MYLLIRNIVHIQFTAICVLWTQMWLVSLFSLRTKGEGWESVKTQLNLFVPSVRYKEHWQAV